MNTRNPLTVCLIDDDAIYRLITTRIIELVNPNERVISFSNGKQAMDFFANDATEDALPDIIFLDINMPIMNGWDFLEAYSALNKITKEIPIYVVSSSVSNEDEAKSKRFSVVKDYIVKPVSQVEIGKILCEGVSS